MIYRSDTKYLGVGVNYRAEISKDIVTHISEIDFIEIYSEKFFIKNDDFLLEEIIAKIPFVLHGLDLSIGSSIPEIDPDYIKKLMNTLKNFPCEWFSDHISLTKEKETEVGHLMPICFSHPTVEMVVNKAKKIAKISNKPFLLENITYYYPIPGGDLSEEEFLTLILNGADCGMLLDLNNLYINAQNHEYDPYVFLNELPLDRVVEVHLAGGSFKYGMFVDTHANPIRKEVWELFDHTCKIAPIRGVIIERDSNLERFSDLLEEVCIARDILKKNGIKLPYETADC